MQSLGGTNFYGDGPELSLEFPTLPVQGSPARWLSRSQLIPMASHTNDDSSADEATSSLGDSAYDFIDDRSVITTDDESQDGMTESVASSDGLEVGCGHEESPNVMDREDEGAQPNSQGCIQQEMISNPQTPETPILKPRDGSFNNLQTPDEHILFEEPSKTEWTSRCPLEVSFNLGSLPTDNTITTECPPEELTASICQSMASHQLNLGHESYRVFYVGDSSLREPIIQKIASALAATPQGFALSSSNTRTSKFNVIPLPPFGDHSYPEVILVGSSGVELEVEECKQTTFLETPNGIDILQITLADGSTLSSAHEGKSFKMLEDWKLPDIAVFSIGERDDDQAKRDLHLAQMFMSRHAVPSLFIKALPQWESHADAMTLNHMTPHICLRGQTPKIPESYTLKRLPVDLNTFLKIDAGQMNRNLACLADVKGFMNRERVSKADIPASQKQSDPLIAYCPQLLLPYARTLRQKLHQPWAPLFGLFFMTFCVVNVAIMFGSHVSNSGRLAVQTNGTSISSCSSPKPATVTSTPLHSSFTTSGSIMPTSVCHESSKQQYPGTDITSLILNPALQSNNRSENFQVHVLGDCHIVMMPPYWFAKSRVAPTLSYKITRKTMALPYKHLTLFNGVCALQIPREEAYGVLNVEVWTDTRPFVHQNFGVDFGSYWLKVAAWKRATRALSTSMQTELSQMHVGLMAVFDRTKEDLSTIVRKNKRIIARQPSVQKGNLARRWKQGTTLTDIVFTQTRDVARHLSYRLYCGSSVASSNFRLLKNTIASKLGVFPGSKITTLMKNVKAFRATTENINPTASLKGFRDWRSTQARNVQKTTLKTWWKVKGVPKSLITQLKDTDVRRSNKVSRSE